MGIHLTPNISLPITYLDPLRGLRGLRGLISTDIIGVHPKP